MYRSTDAFDEAVHALAAQGGARARLRTIGTSVEGRPLHAVTIGPPGGGQPAAPEPVDPRAAERVADRTTTGRPHALVLGGIHGLEVISTEAALGVLEALLAAERDSDAARLLDRADVTVVPALNADGRHRAVTSLDARRAWNPAPRRNVNGVDLNRNWPWCEGVRDNRLPLSGTQRSWLPWYRGDSPLCEPETRALHDLAIELRPLVLANLHSTGRILTYPWSSRAEPSRDEATFLRMVAAFLDARPQGAPPFRHEQSHAWYPIVGASNDWFHEALGTLAFTVELGANGGAARHDPARRRWAFWWANPADPHAEVAETVGPVLAALRTGVEARVRARRQPSGRGAG